MSLRDAKAFNFTAIFFLILVLMSFNGTCFPTEPKADFPPDAFSMKMPEPFKVNIALGKNGYFFMDQYKIHNWSFIHRGNPNITMSMALSLSHNPESRYLESLPVPARSTQKYSFLNSGENQWLLVEEETTPGKAGSKMIYTVRLNKPKKNLSIMITCPIETWSEVRNLVHEALKTFKWKDGQK
jgi:hypothetical protein